MISASYFARTNTPAFNSPIDRIMRQLDAIYPTKSAEELRAIGRERIHCGGAGKVKWTYDEAKALREAGFLVDGRAGERFSSAERGLPTHALETASAAPSGLVLQNGSVRETLSLEATNERNKCA